MSISDVEHFAIVLSGCESINHGDYKAPDSTYAQAVLKLHAQDAGFVAGQEGFLDSIKKGASNVKEWVLKLIKAITDWWKSLKSDKRNVNADIIKKLSPEELQELGNKLHGTISLLNDRVLGWSETYNNIISEDGYNKMIIELKQSPYMTNKFSDDLSELLNISHNSNPDVYKILTVLMRLEPIGGIADSLAESLKFYIKRTERKTGSEGTDESIVKAAARAMTNFANIGDSINKYSNRFKEALFNFEKNS